MRQPFASVALLVCFIVGSIAASASADPDVPAERKSAVDLDALVKAYRELGLPIPGADAPLVKLSNDNRGRGGEIDENFHLAFLLQGKPGEKGALLLVGTEQYRVLYDNEIVSPVEPRAVNVANVEVERSCTFSVNAGLATAIQCKIRGWDALAGALAEKSLQFKYLAGLSIYARDFDEPPPPMTALAWLAWAHWGNELATPGTDRATTAKRIRELFAKAPWLKTDENLAVLASLDAALVASGAKPGSIEALIDDLLDIDTNPDRGCDTPYVPDARDKLLLRGFEAVPALIAHIEDDRLTRGVDYGQMNVPSLNSRVSNIVGDMLEKLAGQDLGKHWAEPLRGWVIDKAAAQAWWKQASAMGEEAYMLGHVLPSAGPSVNGPSHVMLDIISARYPARLIELYETVLDKRRDMESASLAGRIGKSSIARERKLAVFLRGAVDKNLERRENALWELNALDPEAFVKLYVTTLDELPRTPAGSYWDSKEARFGSLATLTADTRAWDALKRTAARVDVGLRMQMLVPLSYTCCGPNRHRRETIKLLAGFLADAEIRDTASDKARYRGPNAADEFPQLAVRDFAAIMIATILKEKLGVFPSKKWKSEDWAAYRQKVTTAMEKELR